MKYAGNKYGSNVEGFYYLHTNGDLIYKKNFSDSVWADLNESNFVVKFWPFTKFRNNAWDIATQAKALGASENRVQELVEKWGLTDEDSEKYLELEGLQLTRDGDKWCVVRKEGFTNIQECNAGFGDDVVTAISQLYVEELK